MPLPENLETAVDAGRTEPILDDPETIRMLQSAGNPEPEEEPEKPETPAWQEPISKLAEQVSALAKLTEAIAGREPPSERVVERVVQTSAPKEDDWTSQVKPESAALLKKAVNTEAMRIVTEEVGPSIRYLMGNVELLRERDLQDRYPHPQLGYKALKPEVENYRKATNYSLDVERAYLDVAAVKFQHIMDQDTANTVQQKRTEIVDDRSHSAVVPEKSEESLDDQEKVAAYRFFGIDDRSGKPRTRKEAERLWLEHKKGAEKDQLPD